MNLPELDRLNLNPLNYRHEDFRNHFNDLTHLEILQGKKFKSDFVLDKDTYFELKDIDETNKQLRIRFANTSSYFIERTCNALYKELGPDDLQEELFNEEDYIVLQNNKKGYNLRSWHKDDYSVHLTCLGWETVYIVVETRIE